MVLSQQIYSTGNTGGSSRPQVYLPKSGKEFLEQHILRKREAEVARTAFWSQTSTYFSSVARQSERFHQLTSQEVTKEIEEDGLSESNTTSTNTTKHGTKQILSSVRNLLDVSSKVIVKLVYKIFPWNRRARRRVMGDGEEDEL